MIFLLTNKEVSIANALAMDIIPWSVIGFLSFLGSFTIGAWLLYMIPVSLIFIFIGFIAIFYIDWT